MKQDISDQKQIYADYYTINKSANKGYHKRCTLEFHSSYNIILFENQIQTTSASPCRTQVQPAARFLVCSLIFIEYKNRFMLTIIH